MRCLETAFVVTLVALPRLAFGYGEGDGADRPNLLERQLHLLTNRVRAAPHEFDGWNQSLATGEARPPLALHDQLFEAARFHAEDMASSGCFAHSSCDGTTFQSRIARFFSGGGAGENIARGQPSPEAVMQGWMRSDGHRQNILEPRWNALGTGAAEGRHWVQNFGAARNPSLPRIVSAAPFPTPSGLSLAALAYAPSPMVPVRVEARLGNLRVALEPSVGRPGNRVWQADTAAPSGCTDLFFVLEDEGATHRFPTTGFLQAGAGCTTSFRAGPASSGDGGPPVLEADPGTGCRCSPRPSTTPLGSCALALGGLILLRRRSRFRRPRRLTHASD